jgi:hypothetical protein|tara:strand:+ start:345 stop:560 length:216 start_codon:yes stop_codon:yes gene_type:complete
MFKWLFRKVEDKDKKSSFFDIFSEKPTDDIERSLWDIKEIYDLPTEEVAEMVHSKRKYINYLHEQIKKPKT